MKTSVCQLRLSIMIVIAGESVENRSNNIITFNYILLSFTTQYNCSSLEIHVSCLPVIGKTIKKILRPSRGILIHRFPSLLNRRGGGRGYK